MRLRYVVPNVITCSSIGLSLWAIHCGLQGQVVEGVWWNLICVGTDKLDGAAAKALKAGSDFGVQLDSLADLVSFGVAPAVLFMAYFGSRWPALPLFAVCGVWLIAAAIRLARFNVHAAAGGAAHYNGTPSTMAAGMVLTALLVALRYGRFVDQAPLLLLAGAAGMLSPLRVPKLGRTRSLLTTIPLLLLVVAGVVVGLLRIYPEFLFGCGVLWLLISFVYHFR